MVLSLDTDFDGCMRIVQELLLIIRLSCPTPMNSLRMEGQKTVGIEIVQQFDWEVPDWMIIPAGNLGNVSALGKGLLMMRELGLIKKLPRIVCAQAAHANPLYLSFQKRYKEYKPVTAQKTLASAIQIGAPVSYERAVKYYMNLTVSLSKQRKMNLQTPLHAQIKPDCLPVRKPVLRLPPLRK